MYKVIGIDEAGKGPVLGSTTSFLKSSSDLICTNVINIEGSK